MARNNCAKILSPINISKYLPNNNIQQLDMENLHKYYVMNPNGCIIYAYKIQNILYIV